ncbi:zinc ribbon domain-containing protein [Actinomycetospora sp.]|uniref:FmdB family zinc ribbon protein n=1 Tax=Actinomycetospora sp. TaxID=1872135 RepID=UPI002F410703
MPTYAFRCPACGPFDARLAMSALTDSTTCPDCGGDAPRGITAPGLNTGGDAHRIAAAHERSAHAPDVVHAIPSGRAPGAPPPRPTTTDPRHGRLPRP